ncbi:RidA family protein [Salmonella enterica]|uniref:RidA family protein n=1 Tax=Salmonella diarizonae TaxID=59204 RepID=A0A5Y1YG85_SALDZ|nr:RidA family protein [Salmonella enterica]EBX5401880.1 RidA family protein [Salmonella enterica subsp. enterica serovar Java]ECC3917340.1 RidA family protein [Salmonella enterica subsp. diarizonae]EBE1092848.1 RidA family protein [Salmonella enterica]ECO8340128.1 RidA family protein [Salmonella enterica]
MKTVISTPDAPAAVGPYVQAIKANGFVFISGCIPLEPEKNTVADGGIKAQTRQAMQNLQSILNTGGLTFSHIVKTTCFISDMGNFSEFNEEYASFFTEPFPARSCVEVSRLPKGVLIEVEAIACE